MNLPITLADPALAVAAGSNAAAQPPVAAAAAPLPAGGEATAGQAAPSAAEGSGDPGAFNALLASLGLLPTTEAAPALEEAPADDDAEPSAAADLSSAAPAPADAPTLPAAAELTPAWRNDTAMLMASLPMVAMPASTTPAAATGTAEAAATAGAADGRASDLLAPLEGLAATGAGPGSARSAHARQVPSQAPAGAALAVPSPADAPQADPRMAGTSSSAPSALSDALREALPAAPAERSTPLAPLRHDDAATLVTTPTTDTAGSTVQAAGTATATSAGSRPVPAHGPALLQALGDRLQVQIAQRSEHAVIRLDPQAMGSVEIVLRHEAGALQVQLSASHPDVQRQLQGISDALRQDLSQRQYTDVSVNVAAQPGDADGRRRQGGQPQAEERPGRALAEAERGAAGSPFSMASSLE